MSPRPLPARFRIWRGVHAEALGLLCAAGLAIIVAGLLVAFVMQTAPSERVFAKVTGFRVVESESGVLTRALVRMDERQFAVTLPKVHTCKAGDRIALRRNTHLWGHTHTADRQACAT